MGEDNGQVEKFARERSESASRVPSRNVGHDAWGLRAAFLHPSLSFRPKKNF